MSNNFKVAIIGGGFAGISSAIYLHDLLSQSVDNFEIVVFYDSNLFGGRSFTGINDSHISNTSISTTFLGELNYLFREYIKKYKGVVLTRDDFFPRNWVNGFFQHYVGAKCSNIKFIQDMILDLKKEEARFNVIGNKSSYEGFNVAILAIGLSAKVIKGTVDPYGSLLRSDKILESNNIAIYGSSLSAIDVLVYLHDKKYKGKITIYSITGSLPKVRESIVFSGQSKFKIRLDAYAKTFKTIDDKVNFLTNYCDNNFLMSSDASGTVESILATDIDNCKNGLNSWSLDVIYIVEFITEIWDELHAHYLQIMLKTIEKIAPYINSFPLSNAKKIMRLLEDKQLSIVKMDVLSENKSNIVNNYEHCFNCVGYETDLTQNALINNLCKNGLVKIASKRLVLDGITMKANDNLYTIGPITVGNFPYVFDAHNTQQQVLKMIININIVNKIGNKRY